MCFSASASFVAAGVTGSIGVISLTRAKGPRELPLAAFPIFFAIQQCIEGMLWLNLPEGVGGAWASTLTLAFLFFAKIFWPVYVPLAIYVMEEPGWRRVSIAFCLVAGLAVSAQLFWQIYHQSNAAAIIGHHVVYLPEQPLNFVTASLYLTAATIPLVLCSQSVIRLTGAVIMVGAVVSYLFYWEAFTSVWCFFAAAASALVLFHFERERRLHLRSVAA